MLPSVVSAPLKGIHRGTGTHTSYNSAACGRTQNNVVNPVIEYTPVLDIINFECLCCECDAWGRISWRLCNRDAIWIIGHCHLSLYVLMKHLIACMKVETRRSMELHVGNQLGCCILVSNPG